MFSLLLVWTSCCIVGNFRCHDAQVISMLCHVRWAPISLSNIYDVQYVNTKWQQYYNKHLAYANINKNIKSLHKWSLVRGIHQSPVASHWWLVDSPHKGPVMWKAFQCHNIIMESPIPPSNICDCDAQYVNTKSINTFGFHFLSRATARKMSGSLINKWCVILVTLPKKCIYRILFIFILVDSR